MNHYQDTAEESLKWTWKIKPPTNMTYQTEIEELRKKAWTRMDVKHLQDYHKALDDVLPVIERAVAAERQFILNILDGIDIADEEMGNNGGETKAIRLALKSRIITPLPDKE